MEGWPDKGVEVVVEGRFGPHQVYAWLMDEPFDPGEEAAAAIEAEWTSRLAETEARGGVLFDGPLARLASWEVSGGTLRLGLQLTGYKTFVGTNLRDPSLPAERRADPLGNSAVILTSDGKIVLGRRSGRVHGHPGLLHCIGGHVEPGRRADGGLIDTFADIVDEVTEELNVEPGQIREMVCLGLLRDSASRQPEQIFTCKLDMAFAQLRPRGEEHDELVALDNSPAGIDRFLEELGARTVPVARACLSAHKRLSGPG